MGVACWGRVCGYVWVFLIGFIICACHSSVHEIGLLLFFFFLHFLFSFATTDAGEDLALFSSTLTPKVVEKGNRVILEWLQAVWIVESECLFSFPLYLSIHLFINLTVAFWRSQTPNILHKYI